MRGFTFILTLLSCSLAAAADLRLRQQCTANGQCVQGDCLTINCCDDNVSAATNGFVRNLLYPSAVTL
ncbi:hypothetical protein CGRA01v4_08097 [Colletotrichum graminicola]|nr:hypothetical protein CGRA01v4_08097 [Colletotrichum graminicola]